MRLFDIALAGLALLATGSAQASDFVFDSDPFAGSAAPVTPGRQIVGGEPPISFDIAADRFVIDPAFFAIGGAVHFANDVIGNLATSGLNIIVLETFDNDGDAGTPFGAGSAANLLAEQITTDGAGFFIYFNQGLDTPRLVYSTNLSDNTSDLKIMARLTNLTGNSAALASFSAANFAILAPVPEPASWAMMITGFALAGAAVRRRRTALRSA